MSNPVLTQDKMTRQAVTVRPDDSLHHAYTLMRAGTFRHLPVMEQGTLVGILSAQDLLRAAMETGKGDGAHGKVRDAMTRLVHTCTPHDRVGEVADLMARTHVGSLPVVDGGGTVVGIITETDIVRHMAAGEPHDPVASVTLDLADLGDVED